MTDALKPPACTPSTAGPRQCAHLSTLLHSVPLQSPGRDLPLQCHQHPERQGLHSNELCALQESDCSHSLASTQQMVLVEHDHPELRIVLDLADMRSCPALPPWMGLTRCGRDFAELLLKQTLASVESTPPTERGRSRRRRGLWGCILDGLHPEIRPNIPTSSTAPWERNTASLNIQTHIKYGLRVRSSGNSSTAASSPIRRFCCTLLRK